MDNAIATPVKKQKVMIRKAQKVTGAVITYAFLILGVLISVVPFVWMILTSFMSLGEAQGIRFHQREDRQDTGARAGFGACFLRFTS